MSSFTANNPKSQVSPSSGSINTAALTSTLLENSKYETLNNAQIYIQYLNVLHALCNNAITKIIVHKSLGQ